MPKPDCPRCNGSPTAAHAASCPKLWREPLDARWWSIQLYPAHHTAEMNADGRRRAARCDRCDRSVDPVCPECGQALRPADP